MSGWLRIIWLLTWMTGLTVGRERGRRIAGISVGCGIWVAG